MIFGDQIMQNLNLIFDATVPGSESVMIGVSNWALEQTSLYGGSKYYQSAPKYTLTYILTGSLTLLAICIGLLIYMIVVAEKWICKKEETVSQFDPTALV